VESAAEQVAACPVLSIDDAIALAVASNPTFATAVQRVLRSQNVVKEAQAAGRFNVNISPTYVQTWPVQTITFPGPEGPQEITVRPPSAITTAISVNQPVDISGAIKYAKQVACLNLNIQECAQAQTLQQLITNTKAAYYNVLRAQANVSVVDTSLAAAKELLRVSKAQFDAGVVAQFEVMQAQVNVDNLQQTLIQAQTAVEVSRGALNQAMGVNVNEPYTVQEQSVEVKPVSVDIEKSTQEALACRPEICQATQAVYLSERNIKLVGTQNKPNLALTFGTTTAGQASAFGTGGTTYQAGVVINWPVWNGGATQARVGQARNDLEIARESLKSASLNVAFDVRTAALNLMESSRRVQTAKSNVDLAKESLRLAQVRYQEGVSTQVEVINAEASLTQALTNLVSARYDYLTSLAQYQRATATQPEYQRLACSALVSPGGVCK
jgi:outer membrane protein TolC